MTQIRCDSCGSDIEVDDSLPRLIIKCPHCGKTFRITFDETPVKPKRLSSLLPFSDSEDDSEDEEETKNWERTLEETLNE